MAERLVAHLVKGKVTAQSEAAAGLDHRDHLELVREAAAQAGSDFRCIVVPHTGGVGQDVVLSEESEIIRVDHLSMGVYDSGIIAASLTNAFCRHQSLMDCPIADAMNMEVKARSVQCFAFHHGISRGAAHIGREHTGSLRLHRTVVDDLQGLDSEQIRVEVLVQRLQGLHRDLQLLLVAHEEGGIEALLQLAVVLKALDVRMSRILQHTEQGAAVHEGGDAQGAVTIKHRLVVPRDALRIEPGEAADDDLFCGNLHDGTREFAQFVPTEVRVSGEGI